MSAPILSRGDMVKMDWQPDQTVSAAMALAPVSGVLGLVVTAGFARPTIWSPFAAWAGTSLFTVARDRLTVTVVGHIRLLDAWTVSIQTERGHRLITIPRLIALDRPRRLRAAFVGWYFEFGPGAGQEADSDLLMFLAEL